MKTQLPLSKNGHSPQFSAHVYCGQTAGWIKMALGMEVGLGPGHIMLDWDPVPSPQRGDNPPQFAAHFYCGQTAGCIKMPLGMEVGLGPSHIVLDGDPAVNARCTQARKTTHGLDRQHQIVDRTLRGRVSQNDKG